MQALVIVGFMIVIFFGEKALYGVTKGSILAVNTFLQSTVGLVNGLYQAVADGRFASFYDNEFNRQLDSINKWSEDAMPNYYSQVERDAKAIADALPIPLPAPVTKAVLFLTSNFCKYISSISIFIDSFATN